jgi:hypothetical protein
MKCLTGNILLPFLRALWTRCILHLARWAAKLLAHPTYLHKRTLLFSVLIRTRPLTVSADIREKELSIMDMSPLTVSVFSSPAKFSISISPLTVVKRALLSWLSLEILKSPLTASTFNSVP